MPVFNKIHGKVTAVAEDYVLGLDGGNSKTIALVARLDGTVIGAGRGGCSDIYTDTDVDVPLSEAESAVLAALHASGVQARDLSVGAFSMAGADWPEDFDLLRSVMEKRGFGRQVIVVNDAVGAMWSGAPYGPAVGVACGTGAAIASRSPEGRIWHNSWWQQPQGGHQLGTKALDAVYRAELGINPPTALTQAVLRHFEQKTVEDVLHLLTARGGAHPTKRKVNTLGRVLLDVAQAGDEVARSIVVGHGAALGDYALAAARRVGIEGIPFTLVLTGGVLRHPSPLLPNTLIARVQTTSPQVVPVYSPLEPAAGALILGLEAAGVQVGEAVLARIRSSLPGASYFAT